MSAIRLALFGLTVSFTQYRATPARAETQLRFESQADYVSLGSWVTTT